MSRRKRNKISGQFAYQTIEMIESPAFRALSLSAHRVLFRIQAEHAHHAGTENGRLPVTFAQFENYGVHRHAIGPAIRELIALGFITYDQGTHGNGVYCIPNKFRLTFRNTEGERSDGTHEWRHIKSKEEAEAIAIRARNEKQRNPAKNFSTVVENANSQWRKAHQETKSTVAETTTTVPVAETTTTSISRDIPSAEHDPDREARDRRQAGGPNAAMAKSP
jgi:hypothetical protein